MRKIKEEREKMELKKKLEELERESSSS